MKFSILFGLIFVCLAYSMQIKKITVFVGSSSNPTVTSPTNSNSNTKSIPTLPTGTKTKTLSGKTKTIPTGTKTGSDTNTIPTLPTGTKTKTIPTGTKTTGTKTAKTRTNVQGCDNPDYWTIQDALNYAALWNGEAQVTIKVCPGTYDGAYVNISNVQIVGVTPGPPRDVANSVITSSSFSNPAAPSLSWTAGFLLDTVDNVQINGFEILCSTPCSTSNSSLAFGIVVINSTNFDVNNNVLDSCAYGIVSYGGSDGNIGNNIITGVQCADGAGGYGIAVYGYHGSSAQRHNVAGNTITSDAPDFDADPFQVLAGFAPSVKDGNIKQCKFNNNRVTFQNSPSFGFDIYRSPGSSGNIYQNDFNGNDMQNCNWAIEGALDNNFNNNNVNCNQDPNFEAAFEIARNGGVTSRNSFNGNDISNCNFYGLHLYVNSQKNNGGANKFKQIGLCNVLDEGTDNNIKGAGKCPKVRKSAPFTRQRRNSELEGY